MSIASSHGGHPLDVPDHIITYPRTARSVSQCLLQPISASGDAPGADALYRQKPRKYPEETLAPLGAKTPPASPTEVSDLRMVEMHSHHSTHGPCPHVAAGPGLAQPPGLQEGARHLECTLGSHRPLQDYRDCGPRPSSS